MSSNFREQSVGVSTRISRIVADPRPQADTSAVRTSVIVTHCLLHDQVSWIPEPSPVARLRPVIYWAEQWLIANTVGGLGRSHRRLCNRYYTDFRGRSEHTGLLRTCDVCGHVLPGQMHELRRATCWWTGFQPPRREQNVQFRRFLYCACDSVCNTIRSPCDETVQEWKFNHRLWTLISDARICKRCSVNQTSFHMPTVYSHFSLIFPCFLACSVHCGTFIQCSRESATDLRAVWYRAQANWIGPEPDSVLRSVQSLYNTIIRVWSM